MPVMGVKVFMACCVLHNFVELHEGGAVVMRQRDAVREPPRLTLPADPDDTDPRQERERLEKGEAMRQALVAILARRARAGLAVGPRINRA